MVLTLSHQTSPDRGHHHTDQGGSGRERMGQSPGNARGHATTGHVYHESLQSICRKKIILMLQFFSSISALPSIGAVLDVIDRLLEVEVM